MKLRAQHCYMPPNLRCPKCANSAPSTLQFTTGSHTIVCHLCGHSFDTDQSGDPHVLPENTEDLRTTTTSGPLSYPVGLACTLVDLHEYPTAIRIRPFTITPPEPSETYTFFVYHQPFRQPQLSFRDVRNRGSSDARYIYAAEMAPYNQDIAAPTAKHNRRLKNLLLQEASRLSGFTLRDTRHPWPISPPGTILATPLAPVS